MGVASIGCHYFTPDCGEAVTAIKRLAGRVEKEERDFGCVRTVYAQLPKAAVDRHGGETGPEYLTLELGATRLLVIKRRGVVSAFNFEPESPQNWFGINTRKNCHPQRRGGLLAIEDSSGPRRVELWKSGSGISALEFDGTGRLTRGDVGSFFAAVTESVSFFELRKTADAGAWRGRDAFAYVEGVLGFPLLLRPAWEVPAGCVPAEETVLLSIYEAVGD